MESSRGLLVLTTGSCNDELCGTLGWSCKDASTMNNCVVPWYRSARTHGWAGRKYGWEGATRAYAVGDMVRPSSPWLPPPRTDRTEWAHA